jgi:hypothetical protein
MPRDSKKKKKANPGRKRKVALWWCLASLIEVIISMMNQTRVIDGANISRSNRVLNPASVRLNPRSRSNLAPALRRIIN